MPTDNPRIQVMLDSETNGLLASFAELKHRSISSAASLLIREALEMHEELSLSKHADKRFSETKKWINPEDAWK